MISFIIPAYNEEALIGQTIQRLIDSADALGEPYEIIVVDDDSSDRTVEVARQHGAKVVSVKLRQIAAVRNAGARHATGEYLIFVDADTLVPEPVLWEALDALRQGAVGGGALVAMDEDVNLCGRIFFEAFLLVWRPFRFAAGCFVFARRDAFEAVGGFDERYFASEEIWISMALKSRGRFVIVKDCVITSARKIRMHGIGHLLLKMVQVMFKGPRAVQQREGLDLWYDGRREPAGHS